MKHPLGFPHQMLASFAQFQSQVGDQWLMYNPINEESVSDFNSTLGLEGTQSFVPPLGEIIWELPPNTAKSIPFSASIYKTSNDQQLGYIRIPHYHSNNFNEDVIKEFEDLIVRFETSTSALVFDQVNNCGGSMLYMYAILSMLTDKLLRLPTHQITIDENEIAKARDINELALAGESVPYDQRPSAELIGYSRFILSEFAAGRGIAGNLTGPVYLGGISQILPAKKHYTKKLVVLINELTFSAPEFLAAILQDNKRALLFGHRTAGAGGCVKTEVDTPLMRKFGIESLNLTWTIATRINGQKIQNIGVHPDIEYSLTEDDALNDYSSYHQALMKTIHS